MNMEQRATLHRVLDVLLDQLDADGCAETNSAAVEVHAGDVEDVSIIFAHVGAQVEMETDGEIIDTLAAWRNFETVDTSDDWKIVDESSDDWLSKFKSDVERME